MCWFKKCNICPKTINGSPCTQGYSNNNNVCSSNIRSRYTSNLVLCLLRILLEQTLLFEVPYLCLHKDIFSTYLHNLYKGKLPFSAPPTQPQGCIHRGDQCDRGHTKIFRYLNPIPTRGGKICPPLAKSHLIFSVFTTLISLCNS